MEKAKINWNPLRWFWDRIDQWGRYQKWWWMAVLMLSLTWFGYDVGRMVTRAHLVSLGGSPTGSLTLPEVETKAENTGGGRLIITGINSARFIDRTGDAWEVPGFGDRFNREHLRRLRELRVVVEGDVAIDVVPVRTTPRDLVVATLVDLGIKMAFLGLYLFIIYMLMKHFGKNSGARFRKIGGATRPDTRIASIAGYEGPKKEVLEIVEYLRHPEAFKAVGARSPKGVLLYGPPGNGKTLIAKAIAGEADAYFLEQSASSFVQTYVGEGAKAVRRLFEEARKNRPCVVFIDEIDAIGSDRDRGSVNEERLQTINALLTEMDGFGDNDGIVVVAATNRLDVLDAALVRPGRFDRKVNVPLPGRDDRLAILAVHAAKLPRMTASLERWADQTVGFSGADLAGLVNEAAIEAARRNLLSVGEAEFAAARDRVMLGARNHSHRMSAKDRHIVAVHELGHALMRLASGGAVEKVSIQPRTQSLGVTVTALEEDTLLHNPEKLRQELLVLMGGRAAEREILGTVTSGAADDMERASKMAREALRRFGWGTDDSPYVPEHEDMRRQGEEQAATWVRDAYAQARNLIGQHKIGLADAAEQLLETEEMSGSDIKRLLKMP